MKFRFIGKSGMKDLDLALYGIRKPRDQFQHGEIFEIPDDMPELIQRIQTNGNYEVYTEPKKASKPKKGKKKVNKEEK